MHPIKNKAYIVAVDMGYGHQRAVFPLLEDATTPSEWNITEPMIISANNYPEIPKSDRNSWERTRKLYERISRMYSWPIVGKPIFHIMDLIQQIPPFYPKRDLSKPTWQLKEIYKEIKGGLGHHLIKILNKNPLPLITSFFMSAFFAEEHGYKGPIYCLCTDSDISRAWAPLHPEKSKIIYLAPNIRVRDRLKLYGVLPKNIVVTGFPLPKEMLGEEKNIEICRNSLRRRIHRLDPTLLYQNKYREIISTYLGEADYEKKPGPISITFAVGGAGAQLDIGIAILKSLSPNIKKGQVKLNLVAGSSQGVYKKYEKTLNKLDLQGFRDSGVSILYNPDKYKYFGDFDKLLIETDILWTKPSELSFYAGLGLPIIMSPTIGSQEDSNRAWLHSVGAGFEQSDPRYTNEWLFEWINSGWLAGAAMNGFMHAPKRGVFHIEDLVLKGKKSEIEDIHFI